MSHVPQLRFPANQEPMRPFSPMACVAIWVGSSLVLWCVFIALAVLALGEMGVIGWRG